MIQNVSKSISCDKGERMHFSLDPTPKFDQPYPHYPTTSFNSNEIVHSLSSLLASQHLITVEVILHILIFLIRFAVMAIRFTISYSGYMAQNLASATAKSDTCRIFQDVFIRPCMFHQPKRDSLASVLVVWAADGGEDDGAFRVRVIHVL